MSDSFMYGYGNGDGDGNGDGYIFGYDFNYDYDYDHDHGNDEFAYENEEEDNRGFCYDSKLVPFVTQLFELLEVETDFPPDASQKVQCLLKDHPNAAGFYSERHGGFALHWACRKQAPLEIIVALTNAFPSALQVSQKLAGIYDAFDEYKMYPLHHALCDANASLDVICFLESQWPRSLQITSLGWGRHFALHTACEANVSLPIIQFLVQKWPEALKRQSEFGLPLHYACRSGDPPMIDFLIQAWPDSVRIPNEIMGAFPLHEACQYSDQYAQVLQSLVQAWPAAARKLDFDGFLPLHYLCMGKQLLVDEVQLLVQAWPYGLQNVARNGSLPLHFACQRGSPVDVIRYLIDSCPLAAKVRNKELLLPLHIACLEKFDIQVIESLIQVWPESVLLPFEHFEPRPRCRAECDNIDRNHNLVGSSNELGFPMEAKDEDDSHDMSMNYKGSSDNESDSDDGSHASDIQDQEHDGMNEDGSQGTTDTTRRGRLAAMNSPSRRLPLDIACMNRTEPRHITMEIALLLTNGTPPLHFACLEPCISWDLYRKQTLEKLAALLTPEDWRRFHQGMLPLHCACRSQAEKDMVLWVAEKYPDALRTCTTDTMDSPLHCYLSLSTTRTTTTTTASVHLNTTTSAMTHDDGVSSQSSSPLPIVQYLVKEYPVALHSANRSGWLPIHLAAMKDVTIDILFYLARQCPESLVRGNI